MSTKYRYYITNIGGGCVQGTDSTETAQQLALCEDFFVVDTETGEWLVMDTTAEVTEFPPLD